MNVLIIDDSAYMVRAIRKLLGKDFKFESRRAEAKVKPDKEVLNPFVGRCNINHRK